jgi:hypothetical protein
MTGDSLKLVDGKIHLFQKGVNAIHISGLLVFTRTIHTVNLTHSQFGFGCK